MARHLSIIYSTPRYTYRLLLVRGPYNILSRLGLLSELLWQPLFALEDQDETQLPFKTCRGITWKNRNRVPEGSRSWLGRLEVLPDAGIHVKVPTRINRTCATCRAVRLSSRDGCNSTCGHDANIISGAIV
jgi:hypothetical protein